MKIMGGIYWENKSYIKGKKIDGVVGHSTIKCNVCGEIVSGIAIEGYAYKRTNGHGKPVLFCSYHCMRKFDRRNENKTDGRKVSEVVYKGEWYRDEEHIKERISFCEKRLKMYQTVYSKAATLTAKKNAWNSAARWKGNLADAQAVLERLRNEHGEK